LRWRSFTEVPVEPRLRVALLPLVVPPFDAARATPADSTSIEIAAATSSERARKRRLRLRHAAARRSRDALSDSCQRAGAARSVVGGMGTFLFLAPTG
jgi:hypothetical protein